MFKLVLLKNIEDLYTWPAVERAKPYIPLYFTQLHRSQAEKYRGLYTGREGYIYVYEH